MSGATARVVTRWWLDNRFLQLRPDAQRILFLLWTAPDTALCGLTPISTSLIAERLRLKPGVVRSRLAELEDVGLIQLDPDAQLCWILGYIEAQLGGVPAQSKHWLTNTATAVAALPQTAMVQKYKAAYQLPGDVPIRATKTDVQKGLRRDRDGGADKGFDKGPTKGPTKGYAKEYAKGAPIRSLGIGVGVGVAPAADPATEAEIVPLARAGGARRA